MQSANKDRPEILKRCIPGKFSWFPPVHYYRMTMFDPKGLKHKDPEDWVVMAMRNHDDSYLQYVLIFGGAGAIAVWIFAGAALGAMAGAGVLALSWVKSGESTRGVKAIRQFGHVAHALDDVDFLAFKAQVGDAEVARQLNWAIENNFNLTGAAWEFMDNYEGIEAEVAKTYQDPAINGEVYSSDRTCVTETLQQAQTRTQIQVYAPPIEATETINLPLELAKRLKPTLIVGVPGAGKDIVAWNAVDEIRRDTSRTVFVFCIDPKADEKEAAYFEGRVDFLYSLAFGRSTPEECFQLVKTALKAFDEFDAQGGFKLLIFNELNLTTKVIKSVVGAMAFLEQKLTYYSSSGRSRQEVLWAISQNAHQRGLGFGGETRSIFIPLFLVTIDNISATIDILRAKLIPEDKKLKSDELKEICARSPVGVAVFHGSLNRWFPMPKLRDYLSEAKLQDANA